VKKYIISKIFLFIFIIILIGTGIGSGLKYNNQEIKETLKIIRTELNNKYTNQLLFTIINIFMLIMLIGIYIGYYILYIIPISIYKYIIFILGIISIFVWFFYIRRCLK
jgi:uncharacterized membrane protein YfcA